MLRERWEADAPLRFACVTGSVADLDLGMNVLYVCLMMYHKRVL